MANPIPVSEVVRYVKRHLDDDPVLQQVAVIGEISNFKRYASGHCYFTLKDDTSRMKAVMFSRDAKLLQCLLADLPGRLGLIDREAVKFLYAHYFNASAPPVISANS